MFELLISYSLGLNKLNAPSLSSLMLAEAAKYLQDPQLYELITGLASEETTALFRNELVIKCYDMLGEEALSTKRGEELLAVILELKKLKDDFAPDIDMGLKVKSNTFKKLFEVISEGLKCHSLWTDIKLRTLIDTEPMHKTKGTFGYQFRTE